MSLPELQQLIDTAVFLTAKQKATLKESVAQMNETQLQQVADFLKSKHEELSKLRNQQADDWSEMAAQNLQQVKVIHHKSMKLIEETDHKEEEAELDTLIKELE
jgi:hypothetical protein